MLSNIQKVILFDAIEEEKKGIRFAYSTQDRALFNEMAREVNETVGTNFHYIAEFQFYVIPGAGSIIAKYINQFQSLIIRCDLMHHLVSDRVENCADIVYEQYLAFENSDFYNRQCSSRSYVAIVLDNAFRKLKPKKLKKQLIVAVQNPMNACLLPFTMRMLASWKIPEMDALCQDYLQYPVFSERDFVFEEDVPFEKRSAFVQYENKQLFFTAMECLKYFPNSENMARIEKYEKAQDKDVAAAARKNLAYMKKKKSGL